MSGERRCQGEEILRSVCRDAWRKNLLTGFNGNASLRMPDGSVLITVSGVDKGRLGKNGLCALDAGGALLRGRAPSSESRMHTAIYAQLEGCGAVMHFHPPFMLALAMRLELECGAAWRENFLRLPLYEADYWRVRLGFSGVGEPGAPGLAPAVALAAKGLGALPGAVWLPRHGICCFGRDAEEALGIGEQLEHLARVQLAVAGAFSPACADACPGDASPVTRTERGM